MRVISVLLFLALAVLASADGMFVIRGSLTADIPFQRGVVAHRNGVETLVIDNTINSPEPNASWVLPIPAEPTHLAAIPDSQLFFSKAERQVRPKVAPGYPMWPWWLIALSPFLIVTLSAPWRLPKEVAKSKRKWSLKRTFIHEMLIASCLSLVGFLLCMPVYGGSRSLSSGVEVTRSEQLGNYQMNVIRGEQADGLLNWLKKNGTPLPAAAKPIVDDYAEKGWRFLVAKFAPQEHVPQSPHPLLVEFPVKTPVYPMRLTGFSPKPVVLELYVIGNGTAAVPQLDIWVSTTARANQTAAKAEEIWLMNDLYWEGATVTRLRKKLRPEEMKQDYEITFGPTEEFHREVWLPDALAQECKTRFIQWFSLGAVVSSFFGLRLKPANWFLLLTSAGALAGILAVLLLRATAYLAY